MRSFNIVAMPALAVMVILSVSCSKERVDKAPKQAVVLTVNETLKKNESFTYTVPDSYTDSDDHFEISTPASHAKLSSLNPLSINSAAYTYIPVTDYTGTDQVVISSVEDHHGHDCGAPHGTCGTGHPNAQPDAPELKVIINITIVDDQTTTSTNVRQHATAH